MAELDIEWPAELQEEWISEPEDPGELGSPKSNSGISDTGSVCNTVEIKPLESNANENRLVPDGGSDVDTGSVIVKKVPKTPDWRLHLMDNFSGSPAFRTDLFTPQTPLERIFTPPAGLESLPPVNESVSENARPSSSKIESISNHPGMKPINFNPRPTRLSVLQEVNESQIRSDQLGNDSSIIKPIATSTLRTTTKPPVFAIPAGFRRTDEASRADNLQTPAGPGKGFETPGTGRSKASSDAEGFSEIALQKERTKEGRTVYTPMFHRTRDLNIRPESSPGVFPSSPPWQKPVPNNRPLSSRLAEQNEQLTEDHNLLDQDNSVLSRFFNSTPNLPPPLPPRDISHLESPNNDATPSSPRDKNVLEPNTPFFTPFPDRRPTPPRTPRSPRTPSPSKKPPGTPKSKPGSPLKLFAGKHDTFTQDMLMRRMSQLESTTFEAEDGKEVEENAVADDDEEDTGKGKTPEAKSGRSKSEASAGLFRNVPALQPKSKLPPNIKASARRPRSQTTGSQNSTNLNDGIRAPKSPVKDRTPKRIRRSLSGSYKPNGQGEILPSRDRARVMREEAIPEVDTSPAGSLGTMGKPSMHTPRRNASPSPTPRRRRERSPSGTPVARLQSPEERKKATPISRRTAQPLRSESDDRVEFSGYGGVGPLADSSFQPNVTVSDASGPTRKGSVTTQDFLAQAEEVMARIRGLKQRSLRAESEQQKIRQSIAHITQSTERQKYRQADDSGDDGDESDESYGLPDFDQSTQNLDGQLPQERRSSAAIPKDARPHARGEERSKLTGFDTSAANAFPQDRRQKEAKWNMGEYSSVMLLPQEEMHDEEGSEGEGEEYDSILDESHSRPSASKGQDQDSPGQARRRQHKADLSVDLDANPNIVAFGTYNQSDLHIPRRKEGKIQPALSRSASDGIRNIPPTEVEHMIPDISGSMEFDEQRMKWVKRKSGDMGKTLSDDMEDPFAEVSDLVVDEEQEARAIERMRKQMLNDVEEFVMNSADEDEGNESLRKLMRRAEKQKAVEEEYEDGEQDEADVHNQSLISLRDQNEVASSVGYSPEPQPTPSEAAPSRRARRPQVSFMESSPVRPAFDRRKPRASNGISSDQISERDLYIDQSYVNPRRKMPAQVFSSAGPSGFRRAQIGRAVSRLVTDDPDNNGRAGFQSSFRRLSLSSALTPLPTPHSQRLNLHAPGALSSPSRHPDISFHQSSLLPDISYRFEATEALMKLELSHIAENCGIDFTHVKAVEELFSQAQEVLIKHLTDLEPFEAYWDRIAVLSMTGKGLQTLCGIESCCPHLEELNVSKNEIGQLAGVPNTVREFKISSNQISGLTAWGHLTNIQYLDISNNRMDTLTGLRHMLHLRELKADDNQIECLEGIQHLSGLLSLRLRRNRIKQLDLSSSLMKRLSDLDLRGNEMTSIRGLERLPALSSLILEQNQLSDLGLEEGNTMPSVRNIKLSYNNFTSFDVKPFPNLKALIIDDNQLRKVSGLRQAKHIDTLSIKNQNLADDSPLPDLTDMYEVRKLFLSRNPYRSISAPLDFMNLQHLELANTQLSSLPKEFGHMMSNTRVLNLNYNALQDIRPLYGMIRLKKLLLVGNRISSMKRTAAVFRYLPNISTLDLRLNPLTLGFYPPQSAPIPQPHSADFEGHPVEPFILQDGDGTSDDRFRARMDIETAVLRRRYEVYCVKELKRLKKLDGLNVVGKDWKNDQVWREMVRRGLVIEEGATPIEGNAQPQIEAPTPTAVEPAEDTITATNPGVTNSGATNTDSSKVTQTGPSRSVSSASRVTGSSLTSSPSVLQKETILASETG